MKIFSVPYPHFEAKGQGLKKGYLRLMAIVFMIRHTIYAPLLKSFHIHPNKKGWHFNLSLLIRNAFFVRNELS